jgi:hypothetical protein
VYIVYSKVCLWLVENYEAGWLVCGREIVSPYDQQYVKSDSAGRL